MSVAKGFRLSDDSTASLDWNYVTKPDGTKSIIEEVNDVKEDLQELQEEIEGGGGGLTDEAKQALLACIAHIGAWSDEHGQEYYDDLYNALYAITAISLNTNSLSFANLNSTQQLIATTTPTGGNVTWTSSNPSVATVSSDGLVTSIAYGSAVITATSGSLSASCSVLVAQATLTSISAVYTQSGVVYDSDSLDSLKSDLVVTAHWSNSTTSTVADADYTLSGTLTEGTSTITVSYGGKTTTFTVTVTQLSDTTAQVEYDGYVLEHKGTGAIVNTETTNGGITIKYPLEKTTLLSLSGIIPTTATSAPIKSGLGALAVYDSNDNIVNYVNEFTSNNPRWAQPVTGTMTEYSESWVIDEFSKIAFSVDTRYIDDAYMYHTATGKVFFAGENTPYYGMNYVHDSESVTSISCVFTQSEIVTTDDCLDVLRDDLVVTALKNGVSETLTMYELMGTLTTGTSTITVYYAGKTTTFNVTVRNGTTAEVAKSGYLTKWTNGTRVEVTSANGAITKKYSLPESSVLYPAGILPYSTDNSGSLNNDVGIICLYDDNDNIVSHVSEKISSNTRWVQLASGTLTEYSQSWNIADGPYTKIEFCVDTRYLKDSYMYDGTTGQVFFAGKNTPYYGMTNISEANS